MKTIRLAIIFAAVSLAMVSCKDPQIVTEDFTFEIFPAEKVTDCEVSFKTMLEYSVDATITKVVFICRGRDEKDKSIFTGGEKSGDEHTVRLRGLEPTKTYDFYAYAYVDELKHNVRSESMTFTTLERVDVTTLDAVDVTGNTAVLRGSFSDKFLPRAEEVGFYYRLTKVIDPVTGEIVKGEWAQAKCPAVSADFEVKIEWLGFGVEYEFYAYVHAVDNLDTTNGDMLVFTTL